MDNENQKKAELEKLMRERAIKAQNNIKFAQDLQSSEQQIIDISQASQKLLKFPVGTADLTALVNEWQQSNLSADKISSSFKPILVSTLASGTAGVTFSTISLLKEDYTYLPQNQREHAQTAQNELRIIIANPQHKEEVVNLINNLNLNIGASGRKSALQQFEAAWAAYEMPVTSDLPINTSLIPIREAVNTTINELLFRRPKQEPTKNEQSKIISIGNQLAQEGISKSTIESWALKWGKPQEGLLDKLSGAKNNDLPRTEWQNLLLQATQFLKELLLGLDPSKFRKDKKE